MVLWLPCEAPVPAPSGASWTGCSTCSCLWASLGWARLISTSCLGGYCPPDSPCTISPFQKRCQSYAQNKGMFLLGGWAERCSLSVGSVLLGMVFWRSFPAFRWTLVVWRLHGKKSWNYLDASFSLGRTSMHSLRGDVFHGLTVAAPARNGSPGFFKFQASFILRFWAKF